ncbi:unnamed protein product [Lepidochelys kempii]
MVADGAEEARGKRAALAFAAVALVLGLPLWWKTTETYRASLPYAGISALGSLRFQLTVPVSVVFAKGALPGAQQRRLPFTDTKEEESLLNSKTSVTSRYETTYRSATVTEQAALALATVKEADAALLPLQDSLGALTVYVIPETSPLLPQGVGVYIGKHRSAVMRCTQGPGDVLAAVSAWVQQIVQAMSFTTDSIATRLV